MALSCQRHWAARRPPHPLVQAAVKDPKVIEVVSRGALARAHGHGGLRLRLQAPGLGHVGRGRRRHRRRGNVGERPRHDKKVVTRKCCGSRQGRRPWYWRCQVNIPDDLRHHYHSRGRRGCRALVRVPEPPPSGAVAPVHEQGVVDGAGRGVREVCDREIPALCGHIGSLFDCAAHCKAALGAGPAVPPAAVETPSSPAVDVHLWVVLGDGQLAHAGVAPVVVHEARERDAAVGVQVLPHVRGDAVPVEPLREAAQPLAAEDVDVLLV
mmetsp:Transcript_103972/g.335244  ORF Transcript_103972/g.335244 Transcript_103972/m.335244 type:complete len:268 (+) Transcript_103972:1078-1881(+)